jgi:hypothetical protein
MGTNVEATGEAGEPDHAGISERFGCSDATTPDTGCLPSVWWNWTSGAAGTVTISLCGSSYDTTLGVYTGSAVNALTEVTHDDDGGRACPANGFASSVTFAASPATQYRIGVAGFLANTGNIVGRVYYGPDTVITSGPQNGSTITSNSTTFGFSSSAPSSTFGCSLDGGAFVACDSGTKAYSGLSNGSHTFAVRATSGGNTDPDPATTQFTVNAPAPPVTTTPPATTTVPPAILVDRTAPGVTGYAMGSRFKAASSGGSVGTAVGTHVSFRLTEAASMRFSVVKDLPGRKVGRRCVAPTRSNRRKPRCIRTLALGSFPLVGHAGANGFRFTGRVRGHKLAPGKYRLVETAKDAAGNVSRPQSRSFTIVSR